MNIAMPPKTIYAILVADDERSEFVPSIFGSLTSYGENLIYHWMTALAKDYNGSFWNCFKLDNGGFYLSPEVDKHFTVVVDNNRHYNLTADTAGIVSTLYALRILFNYTKLSKFHNLYIMLLDYAKEHKESAIILRTTY